MAVIKVICPSCKSDQVVEAGNTSNNKQRYKCRNNNCQKFTFILEYSYLGILPEVKNKIIKMAMNGSGIRDIARVLGISQKTVMSELKKNPAA